MRDNNEKGDEKATNRSRSRSSSKSSKASKGGGGGGDRSSYSRSRSRSHSSIDEYDGYRLHIADIGENVRKSDLEALFSHYGALKEIWMTNSTPCFGFAVYKDKKDAATALSETDGIEIAGCHIRVSYAKPRTRGSGRRFFNPNMRCYQCGYTGHFYRDCPELNGGGGDRRGSRYDSYEDRYGRRSGRRDREHRDHREHRDYGDRDYGRRRHRSSRRYDDYGGSSRSRRYRY